MPRLSTTLTNKPEVTTTVKKQVQIKPGLRIALVDALNTYEELYLQSKTIEDRIAKAKEKITDLRNETGESELEVDDFKTQLIATEGTSMTKANLLKAGVTMKQIEKATKKVQRKPYELITSPRIVADQQRRKAEKKAEAEDE